MKQVVMSPSLNGSGANSGALYVPCAGLPARRLSHRVISHEKRRAAEKWFALQLKAGSFHGQMAAARAVAAASTPAPTAIPNPGWSAPDITHWKNRTALEAKEAAIDLYL